MTSRLLIVSPFIVLVVGHLVSRSAAELLGTWAWIPLALAYWGSMTAFIALGTRGKSVRRWFGPARGPRLWVLLALAVGLIPLPILLQNLHLLVDPALVALWL